MRTTIWIFIVIFLLTSCKKDQDQDQAIPLITSEWNLVGIVEGVEDHYYPKSIGFYNASYMIVRSVYYFSSGSMRISEFEYDNNNNVIRYFNSDSSERRYFYENGLRVKKEFHNTSNELQSYEVYEYDAHKINKTYYYNRNDKLNKTSVNYYNGNGIDIDSTLYYHENDLDSIIGYSRFKYDGSNNMLEEEYWQRTWLHNDSIVLIGRNFYEYENNMLIREEYRSFLNSSINIHGWEYDILGRKSKFVLYGQDNTLLGYYEITYSSNTEKYIIPEL